MNRNAVRVAFYIRVSTADQTKGFGRDLQEDGLRRYLAARELDRWTLIDEGVYVDQGSGSNTQRPEFKRLLARVERGEVDIVLVWKLDRISRSLGDMIQIQWSLHQHGAALASVKESLDFSSPSGRLVFHIFGALAEFERETIRMRTMEGKRASALAGNYVGPHAPFGFRKVPNASGKGSTLAILEAEAAWVRRIFRWYLRDGWSFVKIARELDRLGVSKARGGHPRTRAVRWNEMGVRHIISSEIYDGRYVANKHLRSRSGTTGTRDESEWIITEVPRVLEPGVFKEARHLLLHGPNARGGGKTVYMLARKIIDPETGKTFAGYTSSKGTLNYRRKKHTDARGKVHKTISISARIIDGAVWSEVRRALLEPVDFIRADRQKSRLAARGADLKTQLRLLRQAEGDAATRCARVESDFYDGRINDAKRAALMKRYEPELEAARTQITKTEAELASLAEAEQGAFDLKAAAARFGEGLDKLTYDQKARICELFVDRVELVETAKKRKLKIYLNFALPDAKKPLVRTTSALFQAKNVDLRPKSKVSGRWPMFGYRFLVVKPAPSSPGRRGLSRATSASANPSLAVR